MKNKKINPFKSPTNGNVSYIPIDSEISERGTKLVLVKRISAKKRINIFGYHIPYKKILRQTVIYFKPYHGLHKQRWLLLENGNIDWNKLKIKYLVKSKNFVVLLNVMENYFITH